mgnify:CR=1 FL=1
MLRNYFLKIFIALAALLLIYIFAGLNVSNSLSKNDKSVIAALDLDSKCSNIIGNFDLEFECLKAIQVKVQSIGSTKCADKYDIIEPYEFMARNHGCCFDRARFIEKIARYYDFKTRHLFIIKNTKKFKLSIFFPYNQPSHATSEVRTALGWMGLDSVDPLAIMDKDGNPRDFKFALHNQPPSKYLHSSSFFQDHGYENMFIIYGLYSRHGMFHFPQVAGPEFNFGELLYNLEF